MLTPDFYMIATDFLASALTDNEDTHVSILRIHNAQV